MVNAFYSCSCLLFKKECNTRGDVIVIINYLTFHELSERFLLTKLFLKFANKRFSQHSPVGEREGLETS